MTDEPDGDRADDPSDATSEEDPFIYPADEREGSGGDEDTATDADETSTADDASTGDGATSAAGDDASTGGDETREGTETSSTERGAAASGGAATSTGTGSARSRTSSSSSSTGSARSSSGSASSRSGGASRSSPGATTGAGSKQASSTDVGSHATDRRPHASESGPAHPSRSRSTGGGHGRQRGRDSPTESGPSGIGGWLRWFWTTEEGAAIYVRDVVTSVAAVLVVGLVLFAISGIWPPMVAVESGSMEPNMQVGDLVFIVDNERYTPDEAQEYQDQSTGVVPADRATESGRSKFGGPGDVIVFRPNGLESTTPVIHRAMLWVDEGEDWYDRADPDAVGTANNCEELNHCPAPHAGFITRGDANPRYDQQTTLSAPVRPEWIVGTAELRIPYLGHIRLAFSGQIAPPLDAEPWSTVAGDRRTTAPSPTTHPANPAAGSPRAVA